MTMLCGEALPLPYCPDCGGQDTLLPLGCRNDRPQWWRPWVVVVTELYLCERCAAIARVPAAVPSQRRSNMLQSCPSAATAPA